MTLTTTRPAPPRVLEVDLGTLEQGVVVASRPFVGADAALDRIGAWGGSALALTLLLEHARRAPDAPAPLAVAAGEGVRRGLPTAARATVLSRAPANGRHAEGQVGGDLGARLAAVTDALLVHGHTRRRGAVLVLDADGARLVEHPELVGADPARTVRGLVTAHGEGAVLCIGPAGERGVACANLASGLEHQSFVGRGGLGAVLGRMGLKAVLVTARPATPATDPGVRELYAALSESPRLAARAADGTFELLGALAARRPSSGGLEPARARALSEEAESLRDERRGCRGCPTPCGWVFEREHGGRQAARFGATMALGADLGFESFEDALALLAACDEAGVDAKEVGAILALVARAQGDGRLGGPAVRGEREGALHWIEVIASGAKPEICGALRFARHLGLEAELVHVRGIAARPEPNQAALLGRCAGAGGVDPMKSFPFLLDACGPDRLEELLGEPLPEGTVDPELPVGKGRLVAWHEELVAAVDLSGFCAFSAAGLLSDGVCDLDRLASWILPRALDLPEDEAWSALAPGWRLLAAGATVALLRHELNRVGDVSAESALPAATHAALARPGMLDEYRLRRGLDLDDAPRPEALALLGTPAVRFRVQPGAPRAPRSVTLSRPRAPGRVRLRALGPLGHELGEVAELEIELPLSVGDVLRRVVGERPSLEPHLFRGRTPVPAVWRRGRRLQEDEDVLDGDLLELVTAISGG